MLRRAENVFSVILSDVDVLTNTLPSVGDQVTSQNIPAGAVVMVNAGMYRTTWGTISDGDTYHIVQGKGAGKPLMKSPAIVKGSEKITSKQFVAPTQQITAVGYNGTSGSLVAANNQSYFIKIRKNDNDAGNRSQPFSLFAQYKTGAAASQQELAFGLVKNGIRNMLLEPANGYLRFEVLSDTASGGLGTTTTATVAYGSKTVTLAAAGTAAVGDILTLGGAAYVIDAITGAVVTLNIPYQGETATGVVAGYNPTAGTNFGVRLRGVQAPFDVTSFRNYYVNRFTASFSDENVDITHIQGASEGNGTWQRVALDEYMNYGYEGQNEMIAIPPRARDQEVKIPGKGGVTALDAKYSVINIKWEESITGLVSKSGAEGNVLVYLNLEDVSGSGELDNTANTGSTLATALGVTASTLNE